MGNFSIAWRFALCLAPLLFADDAIAQESSGGRDISAAQIVARMVEANARGIRSPKYSSLVIANQNKWRPVKRMRVSDIVGNGRRPRLCLKASTVSTATQL